MDVSGDHIILASEPLEITVLRVGLSGELTPAATASASFQLMRQLSIVSPGHPLQAHPAAALPAPSAGSSPVPLAVRCATCPADCASSSVPSWVHKHTPGTFSGTHAHLSLGSTQVSGLVHAREGSTGWCG